VLFVQECSRCHQFGPSVTPDLRKLNEGYHALFDDILLKGAVAPTGMESFADILSPQDVHAIHAYLIDEGWKGWREQEAIKKP
jgi:quinohemoprotein ethanol dehydrogenase